MNPFDQFSGTLQAALPQQPADNQSVASNNQQMVPQFSLMPSAPVEKKPIMNAPANMGGAGTHPMSNGMGGMLYGQQHQQQQQPGMGGMYGQQQQLPPQPAQQQQFGQQMMMQPSNSMRQFVTMNSSASNDPPSPTQRQLPAALQQQQPNAVAMAGALVPSGVQSNPYALGPGPAQQSTALTTANPFGVPAQQQQAPFQQQQQQQNALVQHTADPFGARPAMQTQTSMSQLAPSQPFGAAPPQQQQPPALAQPAAPQLAADPFGAPPQQQSNALVPSTAAPSNDPFGIFGAQQQPQQPPQQQAAPAVGAGMSAVGAPPTVQGAFPGQADVFSAAPPVAAQAAIMSQQQPPPPAVQPSDDPWADMGFGSPAPAAEPVPGENDDLFNVGLEPTRAETKATEASAAKSEPAPKKEPKEKRKKGELPPGGEWYDAKIFTPTLGVMFFKPRELTDSLFLQTDKKLVDSLEDRPVVAFIVEGSSARSAGVELGHVLLKVNGIDVRNPKEASRLIKEGPRPLPLLFYVPETSVVVAEGEHMVKYNTKETGAPNSAKDWKPKYVVIGGIIAQPWMMNMYRSKSEYDIAVIETQARRPVSVKVKQFSLQGARIQNDWQGPQMVKYKNKLHPWKYIVVLPVSRNPIKIASPNLGQLKPVHEGIRRVLMAQQRDRGGRNSVGPPSRQPAADPYGGGGGYDTRDQRRERDADGRGGGPGPGGNGGYYGSGGGQGGSRSRDTNRGY